MKQVALISPKGNIFGKNEKMISFLNGSRYMDSFRLLWSGPSLGLLTVASLLPSDWECEYIDENYKVIDFDKNYDLVCISAMSQQVLNGYRIAEEFRKKGVLTVIGGIHATVLPEEASQFVDVVMAGEAEVIWPQFLEDYESGSIKKIYSEECVGQYPLTDPIMPRYDLLKGYNYPVITIQTTRGCPHDCSFCAASKVFGAKYRRKLNENIFKELMEIKKLYPDSLILFADDNMFVKRDESKELLKEMIKIDIRWIAQTDISIAKDSELLKLMVLSGCQWVVIGFESVSYSSLYGLDKNNWKLNQLPHYAESIRKIQDYGVGVYGTFIVGLDQDSSNVFKDTADFIIENYIYGANITIPTPLPGTRLRTELELQNRILTSDWSYYTFWDVTIKPANLTADELQDGVLYIYQRICDSSAADKRLITLKKIAKRRKELINEYII